MPSDPASVAAIYEIQVGDYAPADLNVLSFEGREEMNGLYAFDIMLWSKYLDEGDFEATVLGRASALSMHIAADKNRYVHGIVSDVVFEGRREGGRRVFRVTLVPRLWLLQKRVNSRIFQDLTAPEIVAVLLDEHGVAHEWNLLAKYPIRQYCVQYQESDHHFITRILAEEGIFFCFDQPDGDLGDGATEKLIFADDAHAYPAIAGDGALLYRQQQGEGSMQAAENQVLDFRARCHIESSVVAMRDYDFRRPLLELRSRADSTNAPISLEVYDHHGEYEETDADASNAGVYLEQLRAGAREARGLSMCRRLMPGHTFTLSEHEVDALNVDYVVTHVEHKGVTPEAAKGTLRVYENHFRCVLSKVPFRPARPPRVIRQVSESAVVVGPEGQEIFTDPFGRVKVQFHWDRVGKRNEQSSCWMRVMQPWAGTGWGVQFIPRIGMEVVVNFLGGDQDRPVVIGCLYNAKNPVPHGLPGQMERSGIKTRTTPGGGGWNEIAFDDRAGAEQLYLRAERNLDGEVGLDRTEKVGRNSTETVGADLKTLVGQHRYDETAGDHRTTVNGGRSTAVVSRDDVEIGGPRSATIGGTDRTCVGGSLVTQVAGSREVRIERGDRLSVRGGRTVVIDGEDTCDVLGPARRTFSAPCSVNAAGGVKLSVGSKDAPATAEGTLSGDLVLRGAGAIEISSDLRIRLRVGATMLTLDPKGARLEAETITLVAKAIEALGEEGTLSVGKEITLKGGAIKLASKDGAILELAKEAKLDGKTVKIKPGLAEEMAKREEREEQAKDTAKTSLGLHDLAGELILNAPYEVSFLGYYDQGVASTGAVEIPVYPDVEKALVRWGRPKDKREDTTDAEEYEYTMEVYLKIDDADADESLRRKLHNLGHQATELSSTVRHYQSSTGAERTGISSDVQGDVDTRHASATPAKLA